MSRLLLAVLLLSGLCGCTYPRAVVWYPDSSGFLFGENDGSLKEYNVQTRQFRNLVPAGQAVTFLPAVSPNGQEIALGRCAQTGEKTTLQVLIYDRQGKLVDSSAELPVNKSDDAPKGRALEPTYLHWSPDGTWVLIYTGSLNQEKLWQFNRKTREFRATEFHSGGVLETHLNISPIRPDSAGYLGSHPAREGQPAKLFWVTWDGQATELVLQPSLQEYGKLLEARQQAAQNQSPPDPAESLRLIFLMPLPTARWEQEILTVSLAEGDVQLDTRQKQARFVPATGAELERRTKAAQQPICQEHSLSDTLKLQALVAKPDDIQLTLQLSHSDGSSWRLVQGNWIAYQGAPLIPSPNGKYAAAILTERNPQNTADLRHRLVVINSAGTVEAQLQTPTLEFSSTQPAPQPDNGK